jgi:hypothetical protein
MMRMTIDEFMVADLREGKSELVRGEVRLRRGLAIASIFGSACSSSPLAENRYDSALPTRPPRLFVAAR